MKSIFRFFIAIALLFAAMSAYSYGHTTGAFLFVALGFVLEGLFWLRLFPLKRQA